MRIHIGMPCEPEALCDGIGWLLAIIVAALIVGLTLAIYKEVKKRSK